MQLRTRAKRHRKSLPMLNKRRAAALFKLQTTVIIVGLGYLANDFCGAVERSSKDDNVLQEKKEAPGCLLYDESGWTAVQLFWQSELLRRKLREFPKLEANGKLLYHNRPHMWPKCVRLWFYQGQSPFHLLAYLAYISKNFCCTQDAS